MLMTHDSSRQKKKINRFKFSINVRVFFFWNVVDGSRDIDDLLVGGEYVIHPNNRQNSYVQIE